MPESGYAAPPDPTSLILSQLAVVLGLSFICSTSGIYYSGRSGLPGLGDPRKLPRALPKLALTAAVMGVFSYFLFDRHFISISPASYPENIHYILSVALKNAVTEEVILRLGITSLAVALLGSRRYGVILSALITALFSLRYSSFIGETPVLNYIFITQVSLAFLSGLVTGYFFVTKGLIFSMTLRFILSGKLLVMALL